MFPTRLRRALALLCLAAQILACSADDSGTADGAAPTAPDRTVPACVPGTSASCGCTDGRVGAQTCRGDGTFGECACTGGADTSVVQDAAAPNDATLLPDASGDSGAADVSDGSAPTDAGADANDAPEDSTSQDAADTSTEAAADASIPDAPDASETDASDGSAFDAALDASPDLTPVCSRYIGGVDRQLIAAVAVDGNGGVTIAGSLRGSADFGGITLTSAGDYDAFIAKYDSSCNLQWAQRFGDDSYQSFTGVMTDGSGSVIAVGGNGGTVDFGGGPIASKVFAVKLDAAGNYVWSRGWSANGITVGVDSAGSLVLAGQVGAGLDFGGGVLTGVLYLAKIDAGGNYVWSEAFTGTGADSSSVSSLAIDSQGNIVLTALFAGQLDMGGGPLNAVASNGFAGLLAKYSPGGGHLWSKTYANTVEYVAAVDLFDDVILSAGIQHTVTTYDFGNGTTLYPGLALVQFTPGGALSWSTQGALGDVTNAVAASAQGAIAVASYSLLGPKLNLALTQFDVNGARHSAVAYLNNQSNQFVSTAAYTNSGELMFAGSYQGTATINGLVFGNTDSWEDMFLVKLRK